MVLTIQPSLYDLFVGIDVDKKSYAVTYRSRLGVKHSLKMPANPKALVQYFEKRHPDSPMLFVYEAGPTGFGLYDYLASQNKSCMMVHPAGIPSAANQSVKTNRLDSDRLSQQAQAGVLKGIRVPDQPYRHLRHLVSLRDSYARQQRAVKQKIRSLLLLENIKLPQAIEAHPWTSRYREALESLSLDTTLRFKLDLFLQDLEQVRGRLLSVHRQIQQFCASETALQNNLAYLRSVPGVGKIVSLYLLAKIGDPQYLQNVRELGAFSGLVPTEHSTGETIHKGPISHQGDSTLRSLLIEAAWAAIAKDHELAQFYHRIRSRRKGQVGAKIAIVAVARKLTHRIYRVLKDQRPYWIH